MHLARPWPLRLTGSPRRPRPPTALPPVERRSRCVSRTVRPWIGLGAAALAALVGCSAPDPPLPDGGTQTGPPDSGPCAETADLYGIDIHEQTQILTADSTLPVTLGFQGFLFVRVGMRTQMELPGTVNLWVQASIPGLLDTTRPFFGTETRAAEGGATETVEVTEIFNDQTLAQLLGSKATFILSTDTPGCTLSATAEVTLVQGGYQGPDGGFTEPDAGPDGG